MSIPHRCVDPAHVTANARTFFVTSSTCDKRNLLQSGRSAGLFLKVLYGYRAQGKFRLHEFAVMPDHFHLLVTVGSDITIERAVQFIKGGFAFRAGRELGMGAPFWQKGFLRCEFSTRRRTLGFENTFATIQSGGASQSSRRSFRIVRHIRGSS